MQKWTLKGLKYIQKISHIAGFDVSKAMKPSNLYYQPENDLDLYFEFFSKDSVKYKRFYNIGAGNFSHPAWTNIDKKSGHYKKMQTGENFINWDMFSMRPLPIEDNTAEIVYSSHALEHVPDEYAQFTLNETYSVLKNKGVVRITVPNIDLYYAAYCREDTHFFFWKNRYSDVDALERLSLQKPMNQASAAQLFLYEFAVHVSELHSGGSSEKISDDQLTNIFKSNNYEDALDYCTSKCLINIQKRQPFTHINWYNTKKIMEMMNKAGFDDVRISGYGQSFVPVLRNTLYFDNTYYKTSLYIETEKN